VHFNIRLEDDRLCTLVMIGARPNGEKELFAVEDGYRESAGTDLADIHLHPVASNRSAITPTVMASQVPLRKAVEVEAEQRAMDRGGRQPQAMHAQQFIA
jgi:hypothetical protein